MSGKGSRSERIAVPVAKVVLTIKLGRLPTDSVLHKCDNRCCINEDHLYEGTHSQNMKDMFARGRRKRDEYGKIVRRSS